MTRTKNKTLIVIVILVCYLLSMVGDWVIGRIASGKLSLSYRQAITIENQRKIEEDNIYIQAALNLGYSKVVTPHVFDSTRVLRKKMRELGIGGLGGKPNSKTYSGNEGYGLIKYQSDRFGLRNDDDKWSKSVDTIFIGDSFTHGGSVDEVSTIPALYEERTNRSTVNLAMPGNNPKHYSVVAKLFIPRVMPKTVYLVFYANDRGTFDSLIYRLHVEEGHGFFSDDIYEIAPSITFSQLHAYVDDVKERLSVDGLFGEKVPFFQHLLESVRYRSSLPSIRMLITSNFSGSGWSGLGDSLDTIRLVNELCIRFGCELRVAFIPNSQFWRPFVAVEQYRDRLKTLTNELNIAFYDASVVLATNGRSDDYGVKGPHLSPRGYAKVAGLLTGELSEQ